MTLCTLRTRNENKNDSINSVQFSPSRTIPLCDLHYLTDALTDWASWHLMNNTNDNDTLPWREHLHHFLFFPVSRLSGEFRALPRKNSTQGKTLHSRKGVAALLKCNLGNNLPAL